MIERSNLPNSEGEIAVSIDSDTIGEEEFRQKPKVSYETRLEEAGGDPRVLAARAAEIERASFDMNAQREYRVGDVTE